MKYTLLCFNHRCEGSNGVFKYSMIVFVLTGREVMLLQDKSTTVALVNKACWDQI